MTAIIVPIPINPESRGQVTSGQRARVIINVHAEILDAEAARRMANGWLLDNVGNLLGTTTPELILGERLLWRYEVILSLPNLAQPGSGALYRVGQILLDAVTGEVENADTLAQELQASASTIPH